MKLEKPKSQRQHNKNSSEKICILLKKRKEELVGTEILFYFFIFRKGGVRIFLLNTEYKRASIVVIFF